MKRKLKIKPIIILIIIILAIIFGIVYLIKTINYHKTYEYKFIKNGYNKEDIISLEKLDNTSLDYLLTIPYDKKIISIINEKYFMEKNLKKYIKNINSDKSISDIISIINVGANNNWYKEIKIFE